MFQQIQIPPQCEACRTPMKLIPAGVSKSTGNPYNAFWSCPNNRQCGGRTKHYSEPKPLSQKQEIPTIKESSQEFPKDTILIELLTDMNAKLDLIIKEIIPNENVQ